jgi:ribosome maturation factor RimP
MDTVSGLEAEARFVHETGVAAGIATLIEPVLQALGFRLVRVRVGGGRETVVQIMAERPDGTMTIEDCRSLSVNLSPLLDVHDPLPGSYRLEVSSPGIDRPLVRPSDFNQWAQHEAKIELKELVDGRKRFRGILDGYEAGEVRLTVDLGSQEGTKVLGFPIEMVAEARLVLTDALVRESLRRAKKDRVEIA